jgi:hypothetical protein
MKYKLPAFIAAVIFGCLLFLPEAPAKPVKSDELADKVRTAIEKGIRYLRGQQLADGSWEVDAISPTFSCGWTSLALLALLNCGVSPDDKMMQRGLKFLRNQEPSFTYVRALQTMVFVEAGQGVDKERIQKNVDWLIENRVKENGKLLGWTYTSARRLPDNSNTQYALLGLHAGHLAGARIPRAIWKEIQDFYLDTQLANGGFGYNRGNAMSYLTMDTAGLCGMIISGLELNSAREKDLKNGTFENCGEYKENEKLHKTLNLIGERFTVNLQSRVYYNLYGIERTGRLSGLRFLGAHDWYREGSKFLVRQQAAGGQWPSQDRQFDQWPLINTSFALLFLSKGRTPVLISKMVHGDLNNRYRADADWNNDRNDAKHLTEFVSKELFKRQPLAWQIFDGNRGFEGREENNDADKLTGLTAELLQSPIVYFNGHKAPKFRGQEIDLLTKYVDNGGFILAEACCGRAEFDTGFRQLAKKLFPDNDLEELDANHPVWTAFYKVPAGKPFKLMGVKRGCKTVLIYSPQDLSCYWESNKIDNPDPKYQLAFRLGANIVAYATGLELPDVRLKKQKVVEAKTGEAPRNAIRPAQLKYGPDWQPAPKAMSNLMDFMEEDAGLNVDRDTEPVPPDSADIVQYKFLYMHGSKKFAFQEEELKHLRFDLKTGGTLLADACCGSKDFDTSFRAFMKQLFPNNTLEPIPVEKERLFSAELNGEKIDDSNIRCRIKRPEGKQDRGEAGYRNMAPALEGIKIGNRWVVIYSRYDIGCALEKRPSTDCLGYDHKSALKLGRAAVLYALKR